MIEEQEKTEISELDAMMRLAEIMNDSPTVIEIGGEKFNITVLKMGTQILIAEETCKIQKHQEGNLIDIFKQFQTALPAIIRCLAFAVLNDKDKIYEDYGAKKFSSEFYAMCEKIEWESDKNQWFDILQKVLNKLDLSFGMAITEQMSILRDLMMKKRNPEQ